ncbi:MFS transporter [Thiohalomonas denitrificans]|uniref:MFS transporter n=1 Tax=Thiohalomonas denitrificans TaxID=415747 RepID=UPI0026EC2A79|nr:MFS transporter [Thiohalomonas denitrificans]
MSPDSYRRFQRVRWTIFGLLVASYMMVYFHRMAPGAVSADLMQTFGTSGAALGSLAAMYYYIYTAMQVPSGVLADTLGPRLSVTIGALVAGGGSLLFGLAPDFMTASVGRFFVGLGVSVVFVGLMKWNTVWFSDQRYGLVSGLTLLLGNMGSILAAGPLAMLLLQYSWRSVFVTAGFISILLALLSWWIVRNRPQDAGFPSVRAMAGEAEEPPRERHWWHELRAVLGNRAVWPGFWVNFGITGSLFAFAGLWGLPLMRDVFDLSGSDASLYTTAALAGFAGGSFLMGGLSDRMGRRRPVILGAGVLSCAVWLGLMLLPWGPGFSGFLLYTLLGISAGGFVVTYAAAKEVVRPANAGMAIAVVNTGLFLGAAIMQPLFGALIDAGWDGTLLEGVRVYDLQSYRYGLAASAGFAAMATFAALRITETRCRNISLPAVAP